LRQGRRLELIRLGVVDLGLFLFLGAGHLPERRHDLQRWMHVAEADGFDFQTRIVLSKRGGHAFFNCLLDLCAVAAEHGLGRPGGHFRPKAGLGHVAHENVPLVASVGRPRADAKQCNQRVGHPIVDNEVNVHEALISDPDGRFLGLAHQSAASMLHVPFVGGRLGGGAGRGTESDLHAADLRRLHLDVPAERIREAVVQTGHFDRLHFLAEMLHHGHLADLDGVKPAGQIRQHRHGRAGGGQPPPPPANPSSDLLQPPAPAAGVDQQPQRVKHDGQRTDLVQHGRRHRGDPTE